MTGRIRRQPDSMLEIRGISRESLIDHPHVDEMLTVPPLSKDMYYYNTMRPSLDGDSDDDDESTIVGGSVGLRSSPPQSPSHSDDTVTASDTSHYWSAGNSFTTGNTTERSSVYSWGDDEFDVQASRIVRQMFQAIEKMLFEGVLSGSTSLQHECREWMSTFPHLRILGKQVVPCRDDGIQSVPSTAKHSAASSVKSTIASDDVLEVRGSVLTPTHVPPHMIHPLDHESGKSSSMGATSNLSHLYEEVFAEDGLVEEYLAYDIREVDEEEHSKKYHVPRRRRLGFPPITPNACVRDAVLHQVFDSVWSQIITCLSGSNKINSMSLLKLLVENLARTQEKNPTENVNVLSKYIHGSMGQENSATYRYVVDPRSQHIQSQSYYPFNSYDDDNMLNGQSMHGVGLERSAMQSFLMPPLAVPQRALDSMVLPPSRGSYFDQPRHLPFTPGRLSTVPFPNTGDLTDLMKISPKKLQTRADRIPNEELSSGALDGRVTGRPSSSHFNNTPSALAPLNSHLSAIGIGGPGSPLVSSTRPFTSKEFYPTRQPSATTRKGRGGRLVSHRLLPLDRSKTPNVDYDNLNVKATKLVPGNFESTLPSYGGNRINSPPHSFQPPPTAPNPSTGSLWVNPRLPPINSSLESLPEDTPSDFKRTRGKTAYTRISSAIADDKVSNRAIDNISRPNTTHTFRTDNLIPKRVTSVTPSSFMLGAQGNSITIPGLKSSSPAAIVGGPILSASVSSNMPYLQHSANSPDNLTGLVGITGRGIHLGINNLVQSNSPDEEPGPPQSSWGPSSSQNMNVPHPRRKRQVLISR